MKSLDKILIGEKVFIDKISLPLKIKNRLIELGFLEGTEICLLHKSPNGRNLAYLVRGSVIGLRDTDARRILIFKEGD